MMCSIYWTVLTVAILVDCFIGGGNTQTNINGNTLCSIFNCPCLPLSITVNNWISSEPGTSHLWVHTALTEVIGRFNWSTVAVLYSEHYEPVIRQLSHIATFQRAKVLLYRTDVNTNQTLTVNNILANVAKFVDKKDQNFLLLCDTDCVKTTLSTVNRFDASTQKTTAYWMFSKWLTVFPRRLMTANLQLQLNNVAVIVCPTFTECRHHKITTRCIQKPDIMTLNYNKHGCRFCKVFYENNASSIPNVNIFPNSEYGFNKRNLLIATLEEYPFVMKTIVDGTATFDGFCIDILNAMAVLLNFTFTMMEPPDGEWGRYVNGRWSGLVGLCEDRKIDLTIAPLTVSVERSKVMDFAYPFHHDQLVAIYKMPDAAGSKWKTLLWPFRWEVFLSLVLTSVFAILFVFFVDRKLPTKLKHRIAVRQTQRHTLLESILMICAVLLRQDCALPPVSTPGRFLIGAFWLFTILTAAAYCGNLVAFLTIKKDIPPLKTLHDLVSASGYTWGTIGGTLWMTLFEFSNRTDDMRMWKGLLKFNSTDSSVLAEHFDDHRLKVERGNYVFFSERSILQMWAEDNCDLVFLEEIFYKVTFAIGFPRNSPYTRSFSQVMVDIEQSGLLHLWKRTRWRSWDKCIAEKLPGARVIGLVDIQSAFFVLALGLTLGLISISVEWFWKHKFKKY